MVFGVYRGYSEENQTDETKLLFRKKLMKTKLLKQQLKQNKLAALGTNTKKLKNKQARLRACTYKTLKLKGRNVVADSLFRTYTL